jgi:hypothetical protein
MFKPQKRSYVMDDFIYCTCTIPLFITFVCYDPQLFFKKLMKWSRDLLKLFLFIFIYLFIYLYFFMVLKCSNFPHNPLSTMSHTVCILQSWRVLYDPLESGVHHQWVFDVVCTRCFFYPTFQQNKIFWGKSFLACQLLAR